MTRINSTWTSPVLVCLALFAGGCKSSSDTEQPIREGGAPDSPAADSGWGGEDGEDDFRPPQITPPPRTAPRPPSADPDAAVDAGPAPAGGAGGRSGAGSSGAGAGGVGGVGGAGAGGEPGGPSNDGGPLPDPEDDAGVVVPEPPPCTTLACLCQRVCERGIALACEEEAPLADCVALCDSAEAGCESEQLAALSCKAELPDEAYFCDEFFLVFDVIGCDDEEAAVSACRMP
jgi:hypothetical protein